MSHKVGEIDNSIQRFGTSFNCTLDNRNNGYEERVINEHIIGSPKLVDYTPMTGIRKGGSKGDTLEGWFAEIDLSYNVIILYKEITTMRQDLC